jgi:ClpA/ClpB-like protein/UvrB/UvrC motif-containing protein
MFERFTERARQVVVLAQDEARALKHNYIGTEHLLLGVLREEEGLGARALESLDITIEEVRAQVARIIGQGDEEATGQIPFTPRAKKVLGLAREGQGVAMRILLDLDADAEKIHTRVVEMLPGAPRSEEVELHPDLQAEVDRVSGEKRAAIEAQEFDRAASLRDRERTLVRLAREQNVEGFWEEARRPLSEAGGWTTSVPRALVRPRGLGGRAGFDEVEPARGRWALAFVAGALTFGVALGLGILIGWLIWGQ